MLKKMISTLSVLLVISVLIPSTVMGDQVMANGVAKVPLLNVTNSGNPIGNKEVIFPYKVTIGDQLNYLAKKYGTTTFAIKRLNKLKTDALTGGQVINIPINPSVFKKVQLRAQNSQGRKDAPTTSGARVVKKVMNIKATAYGNDHGWGNKTASGGYCHEEGNGHKYRTIASNVLPRGTKVFVSGYKKNSRLPEGGFYGVVEDTGATFDIYMEASEKSNAISSFGIQYLKVEILA